LAIGFFLSPFPVRGDVLRSGIPTLRSWSQSYFPMHSRITDILLEVLQAKEVGLSNQTTAMPFCKTVRNGSVAILSLLHSSLVEGFRSPGSFLRTRQPVEMTNAGTSGRSGGVRSGYLFGIPPGISCSLIAKRTRSELFLRPNSSMIRYL
jgi:hypothetical protein